MRSFKNFIGKLKTALPVDNDGYHNVFVGNIKKFDGEDDDGYKKAFVGNINKFDKSKPVKESLSPEEMDSVHQGLKKLIKSSQNTGTTHPDRHLDTDFSQFNRTTPKPKLEPFKKHETPKNIANVAKYHQDDEHEVNRLHENLTRHYEFGYSSRVSPRYFHDDKLHGPIFDPHHNTKYAMRQYSGSGYEEVNRNLYNGHSHGEHSTAADIDKGMRTAATTYTTPEHMTVHSGIKRDISGHHEDGANHIKLKMPAFTSTSLNKSTALGFAEDKDHVDHTGNGYKVSHVMHIHVPKGSHGVYMAHHSNSSGEKEFVLHPGAKVHVKATPTVVHTAASGDGYWPRSETHHWEGHLVHDGVKPVGDNH